MSFNNKSLESSFSTRIYEWDFSTLHWSSDLLHRGIIIGTDTQETQSVKKKRDYVLSKCSW